MSKLVVASGEGAGQFRGGGGEVQTIECTTGYKDVLYNTENIAHILL